MSTIALHSLIPSPPHPSHPLPASPCLPRASLRTLFVSPLASEPCRTFAMTSTTTNMETCGASSSISSPIAHEWRKEDCRISLADSRVFPPSLCPLPSLSSLRSECWISPLCWTCCVSYRGHLDQSPVANRPCALETNVCCYASAGAHSVCVTIAPTSLPLSLFM